MQNGNRGQGGMGKGRGQGGQGLGRCQGNGQGNGQGQGQGLGRGRGGACRRGVASSPGQAAQPGAVQPDEQPQQGEAASEPGRDGQDAVSFWGPGVGPRRWRLRDGSCLRGAGPRSAGRGPKV